MTATTDWPASETPFISPEVIFHAIVPSLPANPSWELPKHAPT